MAHSAIRKTLGCALLPDGQQPFAPEARCCRAGAEDRGLEPIAEAQGGHRFGAGLLQTVLPDGEFRGGSAWGAQMPSNAREINV